MKTLHSLLAGTAIVLALSCQGPQPTPPVVEDTPVASRLELRDGMRRLWTGHVFWTRLFVIASLADLPDKQAVLDRLLKNQTDLGDAMKPYYGDAFGDRLTGLLREHIVQAGDLIAAAKAGDAPRVQSLTADWRAQANRIAAFLAESNPSWPREALETAMQVHLDTTLAEVTARLNRNWAADVVAWDAVQDHAIAMADVFTDGTATRYPKKVIDATAPPAEQGLHLALRELWQDHVQWTRLFIISDVGALPDAQAATDRLLQNQSDLGNALKPVYGAAAGDLLTALLKEHIAGAARVLHAAKGGNQAELEAANTAWIANADEIATFLATANPLLNLEQLKGMMRAHLQLTVSEATKRLSGDYAAEVNAYDTVEAHILLLSDQLSAAIAEQNPSLFSGQ